MGPMTFNSAIFASNRSYAAAHEPAKGEATEFSEPREFGTQNLLNRSADRIHFSLAMGSANPKG